MSWEVKAMAGWSLIASFITGALYVIDKRAAMAGNRSSGNRISERTLLIWAAIGGWPGAVLAGRIIRHKTIKLPYRIKFFCCVVFHLFVMAIGMRRLG